MAICWRCETCRTRMPSVRLRYSYDRLVEDCPKGMGGFTMHGKQTSKRKRRACAVPVLGAAGLSLSLASGASAITAGPAADMPTRNTGVSHEVTFGEEEIADVTLATFYVFDKENPGTSGPVQLARGCHGCHGCRGCRGCRGCGRGCGGCGGCRGCWGCGGCGCLWLWWGF